MEDDLNTVGAIGVLQELVAEANRFRDNASGSDRIALQTVVKTIRELSYPLGLFGDGKSEKRGIEPELIGLLVELRNALRRGDPEGHPSGDALDLTGSG